MGTISLQTPTVGQLNSTEDPKITSDFNTIQTWANGNVDDSNLANPNNGVRRVLLQAQGFIVGGTSIGDYLLGSGGQVVPDPGTVVNAGVGSVPPLWVPDVGINSQPTDFQVTGKSAFGRVRATVGTNATAPTASITARLYLISGIAGSTNLLTLTFTPVAGTQTNSVAGPSASVTFGLESSQFALPGGSSATAYALGVSLGTTPTAAGSVVAVTSQLLAYNA
jgi:hypothetical protein